MQSVPTQSVRFSVDDLKGSVMQHIERGNQQSQNGAKKETALSLSRQLSNDCLKFSKSAEFLLTESNFESDENVQSGYNKILKTELFKLSYSINANGKYAILNFRIKNISSIDLSPVQIHLEKSSFYKVAAKRPCGLIPAGGYKIISYAIKLNLLPIETIRFQIATAQTSVITQQLPLSIADFLYDWTVDAQGFIDAWNKIISKENYDVIKVPKQHNVEEQAGGIINIMIGNHSPVIKFGNASCHPISYCCASYCYVNDRTECILARICDEGYKFIEVHIKGTAPGLAADIKKRIQTFY